MRRAVRLALTRNPVSVARLRGDLPDEREQGAPIDVRAGPTSLTGVTTGVPCTVSSSVSGRAWRKLPAAVMNPDASEGVGVGMATSHCSKLKVVVPLTAG